MDTQIPKGTKNRGRLIRKANLEKFDKETEVLSCARFGGLVVWLNHRVVGNRAVRTNLKRLKGVLIDSDEAQANPREEEAAFMDSLKDTRYMMRFKRIFYTLKDKYEVNKFYICDFYFPGLKLIIELNKPWDDLPERIKKNQEKDKILNSLGLKVIRVPNSRVEDTVYVRGLFDKFISDKKRVRVTWESLEKSEPIKINKNILNGNKD